MAEWHTEAVTGVDLEYRLAERSRDSGKQGPKRLYIKLLLFAVDLEA